MYKHLGFVLTLSGLLTGCTGLYEHQSPAPVYGGRAPVYRPPQAHVPPPPVPVPEPTVKTTPIPEFNQQVVPIAPAVPQAAVPVPVLPENDMPPVPIGEEVPVPAVPVAPETPAAVPPAETFVPAPFQPIEPSASSSPAVGALVASANKSSHSGNLDSAIATIERARSIEPKNAGLYYKLALLRLKQSKPTIAEELAKKAALLAGNDRHLKKHSWLLIAHARELQRDIQGAKAARSKAAGF